MIAEFLEVTFSRHGTCKLLCDTSLVLARSSPTRRYTGKYVYNISSGYLQKWLRYDIKYFIIRHFSRDFGT